MTSPELCISHTQWLQSLIRAGADIHAHEYSKRDQSFTLRIGVSFNSNVELKAQVFDKAETNAEMERVPINHLVINFDQIEKPVAVTHRGEVAGIYIPVKR